VDTYAGFFLLLAAAIVPFVVACGLTWASGIPENLLHRLGFAPPLCELVAALVATFPPGFYAAFHDIRPAMRTTPLCPTEREITSQQRPAFRDVLVGQRMLPLTILPSTFDIRKSNWYAISIWPATRSPQPKTYTRRRSTVDRRPRPCRNNTVVCDLIVDSINGLSPSMAPP